MINTNQKNKDTISGETAELESLARLSINPHLANQANTPGIKIGRIITARISKEASS
jgi:hypothetical protein